MDLLVLQEKYDAFRITEDRETDSMIVERNVQYENGGKKLQQLAQPSYESIPARASTDTSTK